MSHDPWLRRKFHFPMKKCHRIVNSWGVGSARAIMLLISSRPWNHWLGNGITEMSNTKQWEGSCYFYLKNISYLRVSIESGRSINVDPRSIEKQKKLSIILYIVCSKVLLKSCYYKKRKRNLIFRAAPKFDWHDDKYCLEIKEFDIFVTLFQG